MKPRGIVVLSLGALLSIAVIGVVGMRGGESEYLSDEKFIEQARASGALGGKAAATARRPPTVGGQDDRVPKIEIETDGYDMGTIANDAIAHGQVKVYNRGKVPLKIIRIETTCPCTVGVLPDEIPPGGEALLEITVDPSRIQGFYALKTLTIISNDPVNGYTRLQVGTRVDPEVSIEPEEVQFGEVEFGDMPERSVRIRQLAEGDFTISSIAVTGGDGAAFIVTHEEVPEAEWVQAGKREYDVRIAVSPLAAPGQHTIGLFIYSDSYERLSQFNVRVEMTMN